MRRISPTGAAFALALAAVCMPRVASAQLLSPQAGIPTPGRSLAGNDDASTIAKNPANLGFLPAPELRWLWYRTAQDTNQPNRGHSVDLATPLFAGFAAGLRLDLVRPPETSGVPMYRWLTWALALRPSDAFSLGFSFARSYSDEARLDALYGVTTSMTIRPSRYFGLAGALRNWNGYVSSSGTRLERSYDLGFTLRPTGTRAVELAVEAEKLEGRDGWVPRGVLGIDVPWVGRVRADVSVFDRAGPDGRGYIATAGVDLNSIASQTSGGAIFGNGLGGGAGFYAGLAVRGYREEGAHLPAHFVKVRLESTPGNREHAHLLRSLWKLAESSEINGVALHLKAEPASSFAHAEELGDAIRMLRSRGKKVFCHIEDAQGRTLHVCSQADRIVINPAGGIRFAGMRSQYTYYGQALAKLGVRVDFVRIGKHKTAAESYTLGGPTPAADEDHRDLLQQYEAVWASDVGGGRKLSLPELRARIAKGPFVAREAKEAGLVDSYAYDDELDAVATELAGRRVHVIDAKASPVFMTAAPGEHGERDRVAMIYVEGDMIDGRSREIPILGNKLAGSYTIAAALKAAREDSRVKSVLLRLETPGGSSMAADVIWREIELTKKVKPVIVSMGSSAASGGYYIAAPGDVIFANRSSLTGSIGIFYGKADVDELAKKIGVNVVTYRTAPRADAESIYRPFTEDERAELGRKVKQFYDTFVDRVARGRNMTPEDVDAVARGHVWTGQQALERKLVDRIGGLREAMAEARKRGGLAADAPVVELPEPRTNLLSVILSLAGAKSAEEDAVGAASIPLPPQLLDLARALLPLAIYPEGTPMSRMELLPEPF